MLFNPIKGGAIFDPGKNEWRDVTTTNAPGTGNIFQSAVWTGNEMLVWYGHDGLGGRFVPKGTMTSAIPAK